MKLDNKEVGFGGEYRIEVDTTKPILPDCLGLYEICEALFEMHPTKAPVNDGFSPIFYQSFWHMRS